MIRKSFLTTLLTLLLTASCGIEVPEEEGFKFTFENTQFRQIRYRGVGEESWKIHQGQRVIKATPLEFLSTFNNYREYSGGLYCFGEYKASFEYNSEEDFFEKLTNTEDGGPPGEDFYDVFEPWDTPEVVENLDTDEIAQVAHYFLIINVIENTVTSGCSQPVETVQYAHFIFYMNGDLIYRDYNRGVEFFLRPN